MVLIWNLDFRTVGLREKAGQEAAGRGLRKICGAAAEGSRGEKRGGAYNPKNARRARQKR